MNSFHLIQRLRLEVDRTLRCRTFISRAIRDELTNAAYLQLVSEIAALVRLLGEDGGKLADLAHKDMEAVSSTEPGLTPPEPSAALMLFAAAHAQYQSMVPQHVVFEAGLSVIGTSWTIDARNGMNQHSRRASCFLGELGYMGRESASRLTSRLQADSSEFQLAYAFADATRGALIGIANNLDARWPSCVYVGQIVGEEGEGVYDAIRG